MVAKSGQLDFSSIFLVFVLQVCTAAWDPLTATPVLRASVGGFPDNGTKDIEISSLALTRSGFLLMGDSAHGGGVTMVALADLSNIQYRSFGRALGIASMALLGDDKVAITTTNVNRLYIFDVSDGQLDTYEDLNHLNYDHHYYAITDGPDDNLVAAGGRDNGYVDVITREGKLVRNVVSDLPDFTPRQMTSFGDDVFVSTAYSNDPGLLRINVETGEVLETLGEFNFSSDMRDNFEPYSSTFGQGSFDAEGNLYIAAYSKSCRLQGEKTNFCVLLITKDGTSRRLVSGEKWAKKPQAVALTPTGFVVAWRIDINPNMHVAVEIFDMVD